MHKAGGSCGSRNVAACCLALQSIYFQGGWALGGIQGPASLLGNAIWVRDGSSFGSFHGLLCCLRSSQAWATPESLSGTMGGAEAVQWRSACKYLAPYFSVAAAAKLGADSCTPGVGVAMLLAGGKGHVAGRVVS